MSEFTSSGDVLKEFYRPGDYIFFEGDLDFHFYIIESGQVQIFTKTTDGQRVDIAIIEEGEAFGEMAFLDRHPRSASAQAVTECSLVKVSERGYEQLLADLPTWANSMLKSFARRMKQTNLLLQFPTKK
jgi:CRP-like cAMP-binding protein